MPDNDNIDPILAEGPPSLASLPPANTSRWVARRKAQVVRAVEAGLITIDEACRRYRLSVEEFVAWRRALLHFGVRGLQVGSRRLGSLAEQRAWTPRVVHARIHRA